MTRSLCEVYRLVAEEYDVPEDIRALARTRRRAEARRLGALTNERRVAGAAERVRRKLGRARRALRRPGRAQEVPPELAAAFPGLLRQRDPLSR
jgi:hypothetical protein